MITFYAGDKCTLSLMRLRACHILPLLTSCGPPQLLLLLLLTPRRRRAVSRRNPQRRLVLFVIIESAGATRRARGRILSIERAIHADGGHRAERAHIRPRMLSCRSCRLLLLVAVSIVVADRGRANARRGRPSVD